MPLNYHIISRDDSVYEAFPDLLLLPSGKLLCVFTECDRHAPRQFSELAITASVDQGRSWSKKERLDMHGLVSHCDCARMSYINGQVMLVCGAIDLKTKENCFILMTSDDEGQTFSPPHILPLQGIMPDKPLMMADGRLILPAQRRSPHPPSQHEEDVLYTSIDGGRSFDPEPRVIASVPGLWLCEGNIVRLSDGTLVCLMRENSGQGYDGYKSLSTDDGLTWSQAFRLPLPGLHRATGGLLQDGRVLITYRFMQGGKGWLGNWTQNTFAALMSQDDLKETERHEQGARIMPLFFDRSDHSDTGYTGWVQFPDGEIYVATYLVDDAPRAFIKGVSFRVEDMLVHTPDY